MYYESSHNMYVSQNKKDTDSKLGFHKTLFYKTI